VGIPFLKNNEVLRGREGTERQVFLKAVTSGIKKNSIFQERKKRPGVGKSLEPEGGRAGFGLYTGTCPIFLTGGNAQHRAGGGAFIRPIWGNN